MKKTKPQLGEVQETLLIPLYGRALDARTRHPLLNDTRARELVEALDYDFDKFRGGSLPGSVIRTAIFDGWVRQFLDHHPTGTVIEVGTGLNTRFERVDNGQAHWFDVDLGDAIDLRRRYFADTERRSMVVGSVLDTDWFDTVSATGGPYFFVAEAVLLYFTEMQVREAIGNLATRFPRSEIAFDTGNAKMLANQDRNGAMKKVAARMKWVCEDPHMLERWGLCLLDSRTFATPQPEILRTWPARYRYGMQLMARLMPSVVNSYRLNVFRFEASP
ncbi:class I SAM-dependent methyltransferase [Mycobacterium sp. 141]|uniref:class I SAM-dependent methyltransferase n=1 Tax=Mycobacterium sp. 141 TaxID=1120797 RepID=UPI00037B4C37|nr:class I SAM-dependent methyltransferase [Mycobacterium sp. 141]